MSTWGILLRPAKVSRPLRSNSREQSPCEANSSSAGREIVWLLWNPKIHCLFSRVRQWSPSWVRWIHAEIKHSHDAEYVDVDLGSNTVCTSMKIPMFRRKILPPSSVHHTALHPEDQYQQMNSIHDLAIHFPDIWIIVCWFSANLTASAPLNLICLYFV
jgi:hypothetical protein